MISAFYKGESQEKKQPRRLEGAKMFAVLSSPGEPLPTYDCPRMMVTPLLRGRRGRRKPLRLHHRVMQRHTHLLNLGVFARRVYAVRQQHHKKLPVRIDPDRSPGKSRVPKAMRRKIMPARSALGRHSPAQGPCPARKLLGRSELSNRRAPQNSLVRVNAAVQQHLAKRRQVRCCAEKSRMTRDASDGKRVLVVNFALHQLVPQVIVNLRWRNRRPQLFRWP